MEQSGGDSNSDQRNFGHSRCINQSHSCQQCRTEYALNDACCSKQEMLVISGCGGLIRASLTLLCDYFIRVREETLLHCWKCHRHCYTSDSMKRLFSCFC